MKGDVGILIVLIIVLTSALFLLYPLVTTVSSTSTTTGDNSTLTIWDLTDSEGGSYKVYAEGSKNANDPNSTDLAQFFANFTNSTSGEPINGSGAGCNISFNVSGGWTTPDTMYFDTSSKLYKYNRTFNSRGIYLWNVTCYGASEGYETLKLQDNITISNTGARIYSLDATQCYEDTLCLFDFSLYCNDTDEIDRNNLTYGYEAGTEFPGFSMNNETGMITINVTNDTGCGDFFVTLLDKDPLGLGENDDKEFVVNAVNDRPVLKNVPSSSYQNSSLYHDINATDEETPNGPFYFNITFISCNRPFNAQHTNVTDCSKLFTINHSTGIINRTTVFENYDVGNYTINFTVTDPGDNLTGTDIPPYTWLPNKTGWALVNFMVIDINDRPVIEPVPNQFWVQNESVVLVINASDIDNGTLIFNTTTLYRNLSIFYQNTSLFPIFLNETVYLDNGTSLGNATLNFTPIAPNQVGNYTVNLSVYDGRENGTDWILFNVTILNINDPPNISFSCRSYAVEGLPYICNAGENTTDPDNFPPYVPYTDPINGTLTFELNFTNCSKVNQSDHDCDIFTIDNQTGLINYTNPLRKDAGNYTINISVRDGGNLTDWVEFNLTVVADYQPNITTIPQSQVLVQGQPFFLSINATDLDNATADNLTFRTETYYNGSLLNETLFPIETDRSFWVSHNITRGVMNYSAVNNSQVGNYTVKIIVNDTWGREDYAYVNFTVWNINDPPVLNFSCSNSTYEDTPYVCNVGENTTDPDIQTPYNDTLTYNLTIISGFPFFTINSTTGLINFTPTNDSWTNNSYNLTYVLNISVNDTNGSISSRIFNLTIHAVNDPPFFNFTNTTAWENLTFFMNLSSTTNDEEDDTPLYYNLTFLNNCSKINESDTNCSIFTINRTTGVINFTPSYNDIGNYTINVSVRDSGNTTNPHNATRWELVSFVVNPLNLPPVIDVWYTDPTNRSIVENDTIYFFITVLDPNDDSLICRWYKDGVLNRTIDDCQGNSAFTYRASFEDSGLNNGTHNFTLIVDDGTLTTLMWWDVNITNKNRPPYLYQPVQNQTWAMNTPNRNIRLAQHLRDPDNENNVSDDDNNLTFSYNQEPGHIDVSIDPETGIVTLTPEPGWYGTEFIIFNVNDSEFWVESNNVTLNVTYVETETQTIVQEISTGTTTTITKIASLTITVVSPVKIKSNTKTVIPVDFKNTGEVILTDIAILTETSEKNDFSLSVSPDKIATLDVNKNTTVELTVDAHDLEKERYEIKIIGRVSSPKFNQSTVIYLENIFENKTKLEEKLQLVKDLFQENPECLDLTELIVEAERELDRRNLERAKELTELALQNCRDLIRYSANMTRPVVPRLREKIPVNEMIIVLLIISLFTIGAYYLISRRVERRRKERRKGKETVIIRT